MKKIPLFFLLILISFQVNAFGYKVSNYVGRIGLQPVHFSLEKKDFGGSNVQGSYYYDKYLSTIPLYGQLDRDSAILCEIHREEDLLKINFQKLKSGVSNAALCPLRLTFSDDEATGTWSNGRRSFDVSLKRVGRLDFAKSKEINAANDIIEIPYWGKTNQHMFIGYYNQRYWGHKLTIRVINKKTKKVIQEIDPWDRNRGERCLFGTVMTLIYMNVESYGSGKDEKIWVNCYGRHRGADLYTLNKNTGLFDLSPDK